MIKSGQSVTVTPGCHIPTIDHLITADETEDMEIVTSWLDWTMSLSQLFNHHDNEELTAVIKDMRHHVNGDFESSGLIAKLDSKQKPFLADRWRFSSPMAMIRVALLIAVLSFIACKKCCAQSSSCATRSSTRCTGGAPISACYSPAYPTSSITMSTGLCKAATTDIQFSKINGPGAHLHLNQGKTASVLF